MAARLRAKDDAQRVKVTIGDMATTRVDGSFRLVYLVFNTQEPDDPRPAGRVLRERRCPPRARRLLRDRGWRARPAPSPTRRGRSRVSHAPGYVGFDRYIDLVAQQAMSHHFVADGSGVREFRTPFRYVCPSELDLMAKLAGISLRDRWAGWDRSPFTGASTSHVSVWEKTTYQSP